MSTLPPDAREARAPWPSIETHGELEPAEREWLHTNGTGAYAMSTVALMHARRYHGLLVASLRPPVCRYVIVSQLDIAVSVGRRTHRLSTHQFPGVAATPGYRLLRSFAQDPIPRWTFRVGRSTLELELCLVRGRDATIMAFTWHGSRPAHFSVKPLFAMRPIHEVTHEHGGMIQRVSLRHGEVEIRPVPELPPVVFGHQGVFMGSPDWWRRFEYPVDRLRGVNHQEDLWTPGTFEMDLQRGETRHLSFSLGSLPLRPARDEMAATRQALSALDIGDRHSVIARRLGVAAEQFRADLCERPGIVSGYPWLDMGTRDALVAFPGLYLCDRRLEAARGVLRTVLMTRTDGGLLGRGIVESGQPSERVTSDASLWFLDVAGRFVDLAGADDDFFRSTLYPAMRKIFERICGPLRRTVWLTDQGLLANGVAPGQDGPPLTWMDSRADGVAVTPRRGLAVELQALWARSCEVLASAGRVAGDAELTERAEANLARLLEAFSSRFWCEETRYPYDCLSIEPEGPDSFADASIRPNALIALAVYPGLFAHWQAEAIVDKVREKLLTPVGLRTLDPEHPEYRGDFRGLMQERRAAYHQGTCWTFLLGFFARAALALEPNDFELQIELRHAIEKVMDGGPVLGQIAQVGSGDPPHQLGGCPAQAWSVAELYRIVKEQLEPHGASGGF